MYQFNYQGLLPQENPGISCIVPAAWLEKKLPTMGGCVNYAKEREQLSKCGPTVFEFSEAASADKSSRIVCLDIVSGGQKLRKKPATIYCQNVERNDVEVVLLNHFFGFNALTASMGNVYMGYDDIEGVMRKSLEFDFRFGIGNKPSDILSSIFDLSDICDVKCAFAMMFCHNQHVSLDNLGQLIDAVQGMGSEEALMLVSDVAVEQDEMLISVLVGTH